MNILKKGIILGKETLKENMFENSKVPTILNIGLYDDPNWWKPSMNGSKRILLCGTYPIGTSNGYSKVVYYISKFLGQYEDIELSIYGFQNFANTAGAAIRNDIPSRVKIHDAYATENPKRNGFGELEISKYIKENPQDIIIIFNDNIVTSAIAKNILNDCGINKDKFKLVSYMDQVYPYQKKEYIELLNTHFDAIIVFTPYWADIAKKMGIRSTMPMYIFPHGFDTRLYYPIPTNISRFYFNYDIDAYMVLNINRNQPRKCWDITIMSWVQFVERHYQVNIKNMKGDFKVNKHTKRPIKLVVGTQMDGYWDLMDVIENEVKFRDVPLDYVKNTIIPVQNPQQLSDKEINILYNACDIGLNTCNGEGFGLGSSEMGGIGKPQIAPCIGGLQEFLNDGCSTLIKPVTAIYLDNKNKGIGGKAEITSPNDYAEAFWKYLSNPELADKHGKRCRENTLIHYRWEQLVEYFYKTVIPKL